MIYERKKNSKNLEVSRGIFYGAGGHAVVSYIASLHTVLKHLAVYSTTSLVNYMQDNLDTRLDGQKSISPIFLKILKIKMFVINMLVSE